MGATHWIAVVAVTVLATIAGLYAARTVIPDSTTPGAATDSLAAPDEAMEQARRGGRYLFNVTLHTAAEITAMLRRAEELAARTPGLPGDTGIALVLHGPEIRFFTKQHYADNKFVVDLAERLDRLGVIEIKMCQTAMRDLEVKEEDVPDFISFVPYGPDEMKRLETQGYVYL